MSGRLADALLGAWHLVSFEQVPLDGAAVRRPVGDDPTGLLLYTPDGEMSAQISRPAADDGSGYYIAYAGPFVVDEAAGVVTHTPRVSLHPSWVGVSQPRRFALEGNGLTLATIEPSSTRHGELHVVIRWRRAVIRP